MKLIILIILIIIFIFYINNLPILKESFNKHKLKNITVHIINLDNKHNYINYDYLISHILRFINNSVNKYSINEIINVDYRNNLYNSYNHKNFRKSNKDPSKEIKKRVEKDINNFIECNDPKILENMLGQKVIGNHLNLVFISTLKDDENIKTIDNYLLTSLYKLNGQKTYNSYPYDLPSNFIEDTDIKKEQIEKLDAILKNNTEELLEKKKELLEKKQLYKKIKDKLNNHNNNVDLIQLKKQYDLNWDEMNKLLNIDYNSLIQLKKYPDNYYDQQQKKIKKEEIKAINQETINTLQSKNESLMKQINTKNNDFKIDFIKEPLKSIKDIKSITDYNKLLEILDKEISDLYTELENKDTNCSTNIKKQNISRIINRSKYETDKQNLLNLQAKLDELNKLD